MSKWNRVLLCASLCLVLGAGVFACKKDEEAEDYGDNAAASTEMTTEAAPVSYTHLTLPTILRV